jgi:peptidyl-prolyl cis-trans isomerase C
LRAARRDLTRLWPRRGFHTGKARYRGSASLKRPPSDRMTRSLQIRAVCLVAAALLALAACGRQVVADKPPEAGDVAVAKVGDRTVWSSDVKREAVAQGLIGEGEPLDASSELFRQVLDGVVDQKLLAAEALKRKLDADPAAQRRLAAARERILGDMLVESSVEKKVNDAAIRQLYSELQKSSRPTEEFRARQIVTPTQADAEAAKKLLATGATFESLAMAKSIDAATRFSGGDLGYFTTDVMPEGYAPALKTARTGEVVGPFQTDAGWVLLKVEDRRPEEPITLEAARPQIVRFLTYAEVRDLLETLRKGTKVKILIASGAGRAREPDSAPIAPGALAPSVVAPPMAAPPPSAPSPSPPPSAK